MKYPRRNNLLTFTEAEDGTYVAKNILDDKKWVISKECKFFLEQLNGRRNPYKIFRNLSKSEVDRVLRQYEKEGLLCKHRLRIGGLLTYMFAVFIPDFTERDRKRAKVLKDILIYSWFPVLLLGIWLFLDIWQNPYTIGNNSYDYAVGLVGGTLFGMGMHELAHGIVGLATGAEVMEFGVMMQYLLPGAYVLMDMEHVKRMDKAKIMAAGIEMNILLGGMFLGLSSLIPSHFFMFLIAAAVNIILATFNMTFVEGFDGTGIISELMGIEDLVAQAVQVTKSKKKRKRLKRYSENGTVFIVACYLIRMFQVVMPVAIVLSVINVLGGLFS